MCLSYVLKVGEQRTGIQSVYCCSAAASHSTARTSACAASACARDRCRVYFDGVIHRYARSRYDACIVAPLRFRCYASSACHQRLVLEPSQGVQVCQRRMRGCVQLISDVGVRVSQRRMSGCAQLISDVGVRYLHDNMRATVASAVDCGSSTVSIALSICPMTIFKGVLFNSVTGLINIALSIREGATLLHQRR